MQKSGVGHYPENKNFPPSLSTKLEFLQRKETWVLDDPEFIGMVEKLSLRIQDDTSYLPELLAEERFDKLIEVIAYMNILRVLKLMSIPKPELMFETTVLQWCSDRINDGKNSPAYNVIASRFDWLVQEDLNNRIFGKDTRQRVKTLLNSISR